MQPDGFRHPSRVNFDRISRRFKAAAASRATSPASKPPAAAEGLPTSGPAPVFASVPTWPALVAPAPPAPEVVVSVTGPPPPPPTEAVVSFTVPPADVVVSLTVPVPFALPTEPLALVRLAPASARA